MDTDWHSLEGLPYNRA